MKRPIEKVLGEIIKIDVDALKKLGHSDEDIEMLFDELSQSIEHWFCPGEFLPGEPIGGEGRCPSDCMACWGGYVELVKTTRELEKRFDEMQEDAK